MDARAARWQALWTALALPVPAGLLGRLLDAWREPQRHYHTLQHLDECLALFDTVREQAQHPCEVELALWFHDAVYDVRGRDNEARSAQWAADALAAAGVDEASRGRVHALIMATCHAAQPDTPDAALLTDIDLAILGAAPARFAEYQRQIRAEYSWVAPDVFADRRRAVLQGFLDRPQLYTTPQLQQGFGLSARRNLAAALAHLPSIDSN